MKIWERIKEILGIKENKMLNSKFIIDALPHKHIVSDIELHRAKTRINNKEFSEKEINIILKQVVNNTRAALKKEFAISSMETEDFFGTCGFAQAVSAYQLMDMGVDTIAGNMYSYEYSERGHAYVIANFPIKEDNEVIIRRYLVDTTYRQFFLTQRNNSNNKDYAPDPGFFVCKTKKGRDFAKRLIQDGYIELTKENAQIYGEGFCLSNDEDSKRKNLTKERTSKKYTKEEYFQKFINTQVDLDFTKEELELCGDIQKDLEEQTNNNLLQHEQRTSIKECNEKEI